MKLRLLAPHVIGDRWYPAGAIVEPPPGYEPSPLAEGLDEEGREVVAYIRLKVWGRYPWPYGLYQPGYFGIQPLDDPPTPRPLEENQPVFHYTGAPEYL